jgi:hypothetical protein
VCYSTGATEESWDSGRYILGTWKLVDRRIIMVLKYCLKALLLLPSLTYKNIEKLHKNLSRFFCHSCSAMSGVGLGVCRQYVLYIDIIDAYC